jgi:hypothetical protein
MRNYSSPRIIPLSILAALPSPKLRRQAVGAGPALWDPPAAAALRPAYFAGM